MLAALRPHIKTFLLYISIAMGLQVTKLDHVITSQPTKTTRTPQFQASHVAVTGVRKIIMSGRALHLEYGWTEICGT